MHCPKGRDPFFWRDLERGYHCDWAVVVEKSELKMLARQTAAMPSTASRHDDKLLAQVPPRKAPDTSFPA